MRRWACWILLGCLLYGPAHAENFDALRAGIVKVLSKGRIGTGFVIQIEGNTAYVVTASHVVEGDQRPSLTFFQRPNDLLLGQVIRLEGDDPRGLALLKISGNLPLGLTALPLVAENVHPDEAIVLIGFPAGGGDWMAVEGRVGTPDNKDMTLTAVIEEGNSGGPVLFNSQVAGVVMNKSGAQAFGKAVPISIVRTTLENWGVKFGHASNVNPITKITIPVKPCKLCPEMINIPAGDFWMGSDNQSAFHGDEKPRHQVHVKAFRLAKYEVSRAEFAAYVEATGHATSVCEYQPGSNWRTPGFDQSNDHPVVCISYDEIKAYIRWLNKKTGNQYRLPTEAEWEYAARAGSTTAYPWGTDADKACSYANVADQTFEQSDFNAHCSDGYVYTAPRGSYSPNAFDLYDMNGNVGEWTCSAYTENGYDGSEKNCTAGGGDRVIRGGSWRDSPEFASSADRLRREPVDNFIDVGFRFAQDL